MITTITLNPSVDRRYSLPDFDRNGTFRCNDYSATPGGKGINVSRVIKQLDIKPTCLGFLGGFSGEFIKSELSKLQIETNFTNVLGETRTCLSIILEDGSQAEILEKGPQISEKEVNDFIEKYKQVLDNSKVIIASGSIPKGVDTDIYFKLIEMANDKNVKFILDSSNLSLIEGIKASPYLIKPNREELEAITKTEIKTEDDIIKACDYLIDMGAKNVAVSLGKDGMIFVGTKGKFKINIPSIKALNPVGSGDSTVAGFAAGLLEDLEITEILKLANACGMSNAMEKETGKINPENVKELFKKIIVDEII